MPSSTSHWPAYSAAFFLSAISFLVIGVGMGIYMSAAEDYLLRPVHAHVNLLGWVTSALMGLFYAHTGPRLTTRLIWIQYVTFTFGVIVGMAGLTGLLLDVKALLIALPIGVGAMVISVILFGWMIIKAARYRPVA